MENCKISDYEGKFCEECKDDYYILRNNNLCYPNNEEGPLNKCKRARTEGNEKICIECIKNYYLDMDNQCSPVWNCAKSKGEICLECVETYCLNVKNNTCLNNDYIEIEEYKFLYNCLRTNKEGTKCEICLNENYTLSDEGICIDMEHCEEIKNDECIKCQEGEDWLVSYCLNKELGCAGSAFAYGCLRCDSLIALDNCTVCEEGFTLDDFGYCVEE